MALRGRDHRETFPGKKEPQAPLPSPAPQHKCTAICRNQHTPTPRPAPHSSKISLSQSLASVLALQAPSLTRPKQTPQILHVPTPACCRTPVPEVAAGLILQADQCTLLECPPPGQGPNKAYNRQREMMQRLD